MVITVNGEKRYFANQVITEEIRVTNKGEVIMYNCTLNAPITGDSTGTFKSGGNTTIGGSISIGNMVIGLSNDDIAQIRQRFNI